MVLNLLMSLKNNQRETKLFISDDIVMAQTVSRVLNDLRPNISILNAGTATLDFNRPIFMHIQGQLDFIRTAPDKVIAVHLDSFNYCLTTCDILRDAVSKEGLSDNEMIPAYGELVEF
jgi:hypothetical protein